MLEIKSQHLTWVTFVWSHFDYKTLIRRYLNFFLKNVGFIIFVANSQITFHLYYFWALCIVAKPFRKIFATDLWKISTKKMSVKYSLNLNCWPKYFNNEMYFYIHSKRKKDKLFVFSKHLWLSKTELFWVLWFPLCPMLYYYNNNPSAIMVLWKLGSN